MGLILPGCDWILAELRINSGLDFILMNPETLKLKDYILVRIQTS